MEREPFRTKTRQPRGRVSAEQRVGWKKPGFAWLKLSSEILLGTC
jgi:hypothetical protein